MQVSQVWVLNVRVSLFQVVPEVHGGVGGVAALGTVVHLHPLMLACVQDVFTDVLCAVRSDNTNNKCSTRQEEKQTGNTILVEIH